MAGFDINLTITGLQEAQAKNVRQIAALKPTGALGRAVQYGTVEAQRYAVINTHVGKYKSGKTGSWVGGGTLRASHRMQVDGVRGRVYIDPSATNPRTGQRAAEYGPYEHDRGGTHAFYQLVIDEQGGAIEQRMSDMVSVGVTNA